MHDKLLLYISYRHQLIIIHIVCVLIALFIFIFVQHTVNALKQLVFVSNHFNFPYVQSVYYLYNNIYFRVIGKILG